VLFTIGSTVVSLPLSWAGAMYSWSSWKTILPLAVGIAVLILFGVHESRPQQPVFPRRIFRNRTAVLTLLGSAITGMNMYGLLFYVPLLFQAVFLQTPLQAAILLLASNASTVVAAAASSALVTWTRKYKAMIVVGWLLSAIGTALLVFLDRGSPRAVMVLLCMVPAVGVGSLMMVLAIPMQASVAVDDEGIAVGTLVAFRLFGALLGLSIGSAAFNTVFQSKIAALGPLDGTLAVLKDSSEAVALVPIIQQLSPETTELDGVIGAYRISLQTIWIIFACLAGAGFFTSLFTRELPMEREAMGKQRFNAASSDMAHDIMRFTPGAS